MVMVALTVMGMFFFFVMFLFLEFFTLAQEFGILVGIFKGAITWAFLATLGGVCLQGQGKGEQG
jgi:hypothetical protein